MPVHLYVAPAACGKTSWALDRVRHAARDLRCAPRVCLPTWLQIQSWRRRLAYAGGALGVQLHTFDGLFAACLSGAGRSAAVLADAQRYRLLRSLLRELPLAHYAPLVDRPGLVQSLQHLVTELESAHIAPAALERVLDATDAHPRLRELAIVYRAYLERLRNTRATDRPGLGWLALEHLRECDDACRWPLLVVDGFDNYSQVQIELLAALSGRVNELIVTLTGVAPGGPQRALAHSRFDETRRRLEEALGVAAEPLPGSGGQGEGCNPLFHHLEAGLFEARGHAMQVTPDGDDEPPLEMVEAPDRAAEVRGALRWLKRQTVSEGARPDELALLARNLLPYRELVRQTAREMGLAVRIVDGFPLPTNPAVAALRDLLRLSVALSAGPAILPRRLVVEAWRSPYFDWAACVAPGEPDDPDGGTAPVGIVEGDAETLDAVARWGRVMGALPQWREAFARLTALPGGDTSREPSTDDEERLSRPDGLPVGKRAAECGFKFERFVRRLTPLEGSASCREHVAWLELLLGADPSLALDGAEAPASLRVVARARDADSDLMLRDVAALLELKEVLRGLVWAQEALGEGIEMTHAEFVSELLGAIEAASYRPAAGLHGNEILVADVVQARGIPFRGVALLGLAEGEFPAPQGEDPLLRDADRALLRQHGLALDPSTLSAEAGYFYEAITRPYARLLLTRPRLADGGAPWEPSPYWEDVCRLTGITPQRQVAESESEAIAWAASWPELLEALAPLEGTHPGWRWAMDHRPARCLTVMHGAGVLANRLGRRLDCPHDGALAAGALATAGAFLARRFGPDHLWSAGRLERYRACPFSFFVSNVLGLEPRQEPAEGLDARQLGDIYHRILERVYASPRVTDPTDADQLLAVLPDVADAVLDAAPEEEGFRETAWWHQTRSEIVTSVRRSLEALAALPGGFVPLGCELHFDGSHPLAIGEGDERLLLRGVIDRVDRDANGGLRVIDYKTAAPGGYDKKSLSEGLKLQLPIYALAVRDALRMGEPVEGFYWHVRHAKKSALSLSTYDGGSKAAYAVAIEAAQAAARGIRGGEFAPGPPRQGCPPYCAAAGFCWHFRLSFGG
jgi:RecB family exonuclease